MLVRMYASQCTQTDSLFKLVCSADRVSPANAVALAILWGSVMVSRKVHPRVSVCVRTVKMPAY